VTAQPDALTPALESASEELARRASRFEVFARLGESAQVTLAPDSSSERRESRELGVACRVWARGHAGFAAAAGSSARAGREAALAALDGMRPAADPLPPRDALGTSGSALPHPAADREEREQFAHALTAAFAAGAHQVRLVQARLLTGTSVAALRTGDGFLARATAGGAVVELLLAPPAGPWRHVHVAAAGLADLAPDALAARAIEACLLATRGEAPPRQLADVLLAPAVAAPLVVALAQHLARELSDDDTIARSRVSQAWQLVDERPGPAGLLPLPWDGEGLAARRIVLAAGGRLGERFATWERAQRTGERPGGAVRPSYRHPPFPGPSNLVVLPTAAARQADLLARLESGFYLVLPAGPVRVDHASGRFALRAAAVAVRRSRALAAHPLVDLRGSFRRLLGGLAFTGGDVESFSLASAVTTPSMLFRRLEIA
jgi:predicted Zn-dependent protease